MNLQQLFLQRYDVLCDFWIGDVWKIVPEGVMRTRPHTRLNSIAWNLWHIARVEDAGLNRFVADRPQVFDDGQWMQPLNVPWRHHGSGMTMPEVDELNSRIDLVALYDYSAAVQARTREIVAQIDPAGLDATMQPEQLRSILFDEGLAHRQAAGLMEAYAGWTKGKCLMNFGLTHSYQHVGVIGVIAKLLGVEF